MYMYMYNSSFSKALLVYFATHHHMLLGLILAG